MELPKLSTKQIIGGAVALGAVGAVGTAAVVSRRRKKARTKRAAKHKNIRKKIYRGRKLRFGSKAYRKKYLKHGRRTPHTAGKRRDTSQRRIRYTKTHQPYIILASGKARFISKKSAKSSYKRKGGRY
jgi:hypothetical protein